MFNPDELLNEATNEAGDTKYQPIPAGEWLAVVEDIELKQETSKKTGEVFVILNITWSIIDDQVKEAMGRDTISIRQSIFPDIRSDGKGLDFSAGKNVPLGRIREALGMNQPGQPFKLGDLRGAGPAKVRVTHTPAKDSDDIYSNVKSVGKAA